MEITGKLPPTGSKPVTVNNSYRTGVQDSSLSNSFQNLNLSTQGSGNVSLNLSAVNTPKQRAKSPNGKTRSQLNKSGSRQCRTPGGDRFISDRSNFEMSNYLLQQNTTNDSASSSDAGGNENSGTVELKPKDMSVYTRTLNETVLGVSDLSGSRILSFSQKPKCAPEGYQNALKVVYQGQGVKPTGTKYRVLPKSPDRVLDAPDVVDDYYLNLLDWSNTNIVAIALRDQVYLWKAHTAEITRLPCDVQDGVSMITTISWVRDGSHILCATDIGTIQVWDVNKVKLVRNMRTPDVDLRIAGMDIEGHQVVQGNRRGTMRQHDLRVADHITYTVRNAHSQEICGVKWSPDGRFYATGGNDNAVNIWDAMNMSNDAKPVCCFTQHLAAVKALCWSPTHSSVLASGGGTNDRTIKIWNVSSGTLLKSTDAESQVSGLIWSENYREIISSHGYSRNHLAVWKYPDMSKVGDILGHQLRVLQMALSPDKTTVATISADETLRFWRVFPPTKSTKDLAKMKAKSVLTFHTLR